jgi:hypothetical protein
MLRRLKQGARSAPCFYTLIRSQHIVIVVVSKARFEVSFNPLLGNFCSVSKEPRTRSAGIDHGKCLDSA